MLVCQVQRKCLCLSIDVVFYKEIVCICIDRIDEKYLFILFNISVYVLLLFFNALTSKLLVFDFPYKRFIMFHVAFRGLTEFMMYSALFCLFEFSISVLRLLQNSLYIALSNLLD